MYNSACAQQTFTDRLPELVHRYSRRTSRVVELARLFAHTAGGRPAGRLMQRLGLPQSKDTLLRSVKRGVSRQGSACPARVVGIDDWSWRKGSRYGTIMVDLERREVLDVLEDRSAETTARWLGQRPTIEMVSRDRCGIYAQGATRGAPQARQIADRFHLLQNLRQTIEQQLSRAPRHALHFDLGMADELAEPHDLIHRYGQPEVTEHRILIHGRRRAKSQVAFDRVKALRAEGKTLAGIAHETGFNWRTVRKWTRQDGLRLQATMAPKSTTPAYFRAYLAQRWNEGCSMGKQLLAEIRPLGYTGSLTHLQRFLNKWRQAHYAATSVFPAPEQIARLIVPPIAAAALCIKPRGLLTVDQLSKVNGLKETSGDFVIMRKLSMRFRGILRGGDTKPMDHWVLDAANSGIHSMRQFAARLRQDIAAVRNAICEPWSNGQTEGQINRLKTLKRAMYGRAGVELLRARMLPFHEDNNIT